MKPPVLALALSLLIGSLALSRADDRFSFAATPGKLPKNVVPRQYRIELTPDLAGGTTDGTVWVSIEALRPARQIVFNALNMKIHEVAFVSPTAEVRCGEPVVDPDEQTVTVPLSRELPPGRHELRIAFTGVINETPEGLYFDRYQTATGEKVLITTQMEPTDARRMFPCWDEPAFRATFQLTVRIPRNHTPVSNTPIEHEEESDGLKIVRFAVTPSMPTYLMVFVSGELEELRDEIAGIQLRIVTTEGKREFGRYAMEATRKIIPYFNEYFGIPYSLPKLDQIAVNSFAFGAMENWGGIVYREDVLLFDPASSHPSTRERIFSIVAHEIAHQWYGNLVTMAWWDNLWLNESFASWIAAKVTDRFNPEWKVWQRENSSKEAAMRLDARRTTHQIQQRVLNESQAMDAFDVITYEKGQAFLRMLETHLGEGAFREGMRRYMAEHKFSNTTAADLWHALESASGKPVQALAAAWTEQPGFPVIRASGACVDQALRLALVQERFTVNYADAPQLRWSVPVAVGTGSSLRPIESFLLSEAEGTVTLDGCPGVWKLNAGNTGYYRVQYDPQAFEQLRLHLFRLPADDQLNLLSDTWALAQADRVSLTSYFALVEQLRESNSQPLWQQIIGALRFIDTLFDQQPESDPFRQYARSLLRPHLDRLGWESRPSDDYLDVLLRAAVIHALGDFGDSSVIEEAHRRFHRFLAEPESLPGDLRPAVLNITGRYANPVTYDLIHQRARQSTGLEERRMFYNALEAARDPELALRTLRLSLTDELPPLYAARLVPGVASASSNPELAWNFAREHRAALIEKVPASRRNGYFPSIFNAFSETSRADELEEFTRANFPPDAMKKAAEVADDIRFRYLFKQRERDDLGAWLKTQE